MIQIRIDPDQYDQDFEIVDLTPENIVDAILKMTVEQWKDLLEYSRAKGISICIEVD